MTAAEASETPAPPAGRWFGPVRPLPRWPLRTTAVVVALVFYKALEADFWPYIYKGHNADLLCLLMIYLGVTVWQIVRIVKSVLSGSRRALRLSISLADVGLSWLAVRQIPTLTIGVFAAHVALFHPCDRFGPATRLAICLNRDGPEYGNFVMYDPHDEFLRPLEMRSPKWKAAFARLVIFHDVLACTGVVKLATHVFFVSCG